MKFGKQASITPQTFCVETRLTSDIRTAIARDGDVSELGVSEANLRHQLFARGGLPEWLLLKRQELIGLEMVSKQQIEDAYQIRIINLSR